MAPIITHLTNAIITICTFPDTLKITKIIPTHKSGKPIFDIESFRPLNNLCTVEKIIEEYAKFHFDKYLIKKKIINKYHHGGGKGHSTTTTLTTILNTIHKKFESNQKSMDSEYRYHQEHLNIPFQSIGPLPRRSTED